MHVKTHIFEKDMKEGRTKDKIKGEELKTKAKEKV